MSEEAIAAHYDRLVDDFKDFVNHVAESVKDLYNLYAYSGDRSFFDDFPEPDKTMSPYMALSLVGVHAFCRELHHEPRGIGSRARPEEVAEWIVFHPLLAVLKQEATWYADGLWRRAYDGDAGSVMMDFTFYCHGCEWRHDGMCEWW